MVDEAFDCFDVERTIQQIAEQHGISPSQVATTIELLDAGNTIPFIARYRKEATQGLDEIALRAVEDALAKARELASRKSTILKTISGQDQLTPELRKQIEDCFDKQALEDLYLPFKPKRRTRATLARERGLEPLAEILWRQQRLHRPTSAVLAGFVNPDKEVPDAEAALQGACDIVAERWSEDAPMRAWLIAQGRGFGRLTAKVKRGKKEAGEKFELYFNFSESVKRLPSHRLLAIKRGESEGILRVGMELDDEFTLRKLKSHWVRNRQFEFYETLLETVEDCYRRLMLPSMESTLLQELKEKADAEAIAVFAKNLRNLLLAAPAGPHVTIGMDPGFRTGCKLAVVDETGRFQTGATIFPTPPRNDTSGAEATLSRLIEQYQVKLIAIGNGTASRETDAFVEQFLQARKLPITKAVVSESGASIYSASELAGREYPDLDVTVRGAISIAHRLQDPLAELVKIDPKSIGVGQYQHDVDQTALRKSLDREVESCVNSVGVDVNMASSRLLAHVAGIGPKLADGIVSYRDQQGRFNSRDQLKKVPKFGPKAFQQAAGFLRIRDGLQPLDNSAVHPESYYVVEGMAKRLNSETSRLVGNPELAATLNAEEFVDDRVGLPTVIDILAELAKPGRDPRQEFRAVKFADGVSEMKDLRPGMILEAVVTNVTRFGAFVDIGVHQDALVHVSELANRFVEDPSDIVSVGDVFRVKVLDVDIDRRRIGASRKQCQSPT